MIIVILRPVQKFLKGLEENLRSKIYRHINLLDEQAIGLSMPFSKKIAKNFYELRVLGVINVRIFYTFHAGTIYLLHGFIKTTHKIPAKHLKLGQRRLKNIELI